MSERVAGHVPDNLARERLALRFSAVQPPLHNHEASGEVTVHVGHHIRLASAIRLERHSAPMLVHGSLSNLQRVRNRLVMKACEVQTEHYALDGTATAFCSVRGNHRFECIGLAGRLRAFDSTVEHAQLTARHVPPDARFRCPKFSDTTTASNLVRNRIGNSKRGWIALTKSPAS